MRGDVAEALAESAKLPGGSLRAMLLALSGREAEAIADLKNHEARMPQVIIRRFSVALRTLLEGDRSASLGAILDLLERGPRDPEGLYFLARHLARLDEVDRANRVLAAAVAGGFTASRVMEWDPWLDALRPTPAFAATRAAADTRLAAAIDAYVHASGESISRRGGGSTNAAALARLRLRPMRAQPR